MVSGHSERAGFLDAWVAERRFRALRFGKGGFRVFGNHLAFMLCDRCEYMNRKGGD